jgi:hypothetical protein
MLEFVKDSKAEYEEQFIKEKKDKNDDKKSKNSLVDNPSRVSTMKFL